MTGTYVDNISGEQLLIRIGNGASPEVFLHDCLLNASRGIKLTLNTTSQEVARCDDPTAPMKVMRRGKSVDSQIPFSGTLKASSFAAWMDWCMGGQPKNIQVYQNLAGSLGGWQLAGKYLLTSIEGTGVNLQDQTVQGTLEQADLPVRTTNAG